MANSNAQQNTNVGYYDNAEVVPRGKRITGFSSSKRGRINNDFEYLESTNLRPNTTNDQRFNANYSKQGLQPQDLNAKKITKGKKAANDDSYAGIDEEQRRQVSRMAQVANLLSKKKAAAVTKKLILRTRASAVNSSIFAWGGSLWLSLQLPLAIISLIMLGVMGAVRGVLTSSGFVGSSLAWLGEKLAAGVKFISGIDINLAAMADGLFIIPYVLIIAIGILTILGAYLQYSLSFLRPLSGEKSGLKLGLLLLALIGYSVPLLNLFPWVLLWMAAVWKYPR